VGLEAAYRAAFGGGSQTIHGNWNEVYGNHLHWNESERSFTPKTKWKRPRPQVITALALIVVETIKIYFDFMGGDEVGEHFEGLAQQNLHSGRGSRGLSQWQKMAQNLVT
jgi:hypothetical protein